MYIATFALFFFMLKNYHCDCYCRSTKLQSKSEVLTLKLTILEELKKDWISSDHSQMLLTTKPKLSLSELKAKYHSLTDPPLPPTNLDFTFTWRWGGGLSQQDSTKTVQTYYFVLMLVSTSFR